MTTDLRRELLRLAARPVPVCTPEHAGRWWETLPPPTPGPTDHEASDGH